MAAVVGSTRSLDCLWSVALVLALALPVHGQLVFATDAGCSVTVLPNSTTPCLLQSALIAGDCQRSRRPDSIIEKSVMSPNLVLFDVARSRVLELKTRLHKRLWPSRKLLDHLDLPHSVVALQFCPSQNSVILLTLRSRTFSVLRVDAERMLPYEVLSLPFVKSVRDGVSAFDDQSSRFFFVLSHSSPAACEQRLVAVNIVSRAVESDVPLSHCLQLGFLQWVPLRQALVATHGRGVVMISLLGNVTDIPWVVLPADTTGLMVRGTSFDKRSSILHATLTRRAGRLGAVFVDFSSNRSSAVPACEFVSELHELRALPAVEEAPFAVEARGETVVMKGSGFFSRPTAITCQLPSLGDSLSAYVVSDTEIRCTLPAVKGFVLSVSFEVAVFNRTVFSRTLVITDKSFPTALFTEVLGALCATAVFLGLVGYRRHDTIASRCFVLLTTVFDVCADGSLLHLLAEFRPLQAIGYCVTIAGPITFNLLFLTAISRNRKYTRVRNDGEASLPLTPHSGCRRFWTHVLGSLNLRCAHPFLVGSLGDSELGKLLTTAVCVNLLREGVQLALLLQSQADLQRWAAQIVVALGASVGTLLVEVSGLRHALVAVFQRCLRRGVRDDALVSFRARFASGPHSCAVQLIHVASNGRVVMPSAFYDSPIRLEAYRLIAWIGGGHFGEAHLAVRPRDFAAKNLTWEGKTCKELFLAKVPKWVVKRCKEGNDDERSVALHVSREVKALKHLVAYDREVADKEGHGSALVFEYCNGGDLETFIKWMDEPKQDIGEPKNGQDISEFEVLSLTKQLMDALLSLKAAHILHNDVAPRNVFLHWEPDPFGEHWELVLKLGDFGLSVDLGDKKTATGRHKYSSHVAPEIAADVHYDERADSYALGVVMYELMTGKLVNLQRYGLHWEDDKRQEVAHELQENDDLVRRFPSLIVLARKLTMRQPSDRPRLESVLAELDQLETQVPKTANCLERYLEKRLQPTQATIEMGEMKGDFKSDAKR